MKKTFALIGLAMVCLACVAWTRVVTSHEHVTGYATTTKVCNGRYILIQNTTATTTANLGIVNIAATDTNPMQVIAGQNPIRIDAPSGVPFKISLKGAAVSDTCVVNVWECY